jgi:hypothetical protein
MHNFLFLDVDGVLNTHESINRYGVDQIDDDKLDLLRSIVFATDVRIVLSSYWRLDPYNYSLVERGLAGKGLSIHSKTPFLPATEFDRWEEILNWLGAEDDLINSYHSQPNHPTLAKDSKIVVIDDREDADLPEIFRPRHYKFVKTSSYHGLTPELAIDIVEFLKKKES